MNTKLTLSLKKEIIEKAKGYAKEHNVSLSSLVENYLLRLISDSTNTSDHADGIVEKLAGIITLDKADYKEEHSAYLTNKYK